MNKPVCKKKKTQTMIQKSLKKIKSVMNKLEKISHVIYIL